MEAERAVARILKALGHPVRIKLLNLLRGGEECVCHLTAALGLPQPYISQHLAVLRNAGLIVARKEGLNIYYRLADNRILALLDSLLEFLREEKGEEEISFTLSAPVRLPAICPCPKCQNQEKYPEGRLDG